MNRAMLMLFIILGMSISMPLGRVKATLNSETYIQQQDLLKVHMFPLYIWQVNRAAINKKRNYIFPKMPVIIRQPLDIYYLLTYNTIFHPLRLQILQKLLLNWIN
jgi:hypothetical protein